ncbi:hypothetical protein [Arthrobacter sp. KBS0702]|uniref:hypothetical protein n=1 Tax=Arthrobacter sp. KBS0702 TaxID=2578107 RepID=UPI001643E60C|nr:hypothetical protein [Arthrobacter sp. KBS0702]
MKRTIATLGVVGLGVMGAAVSANAAPPDKITICHATKAAGNPFVAETINLNALKAHADDTLDIVPENSGDIMPKGQNLSQANLALLANNCVAVAVVVPPVDPPGNPPVDPPGNPPVDPPGNPPVDPPGNPPVDPPGNPPVDPPGNPPVDPPGNPPVDPPGNPPVDPPGNPPVDPPGNPPADTGTNPAANPAPGTTVPLQPSTAVTPLKVDGKAVTAVPQASLSPAAAKPAPAATPAKVNVGFNVQTAVGRSHTPDGLPAWLLGLTGLFAAGSGAVLWRGGQRARRAAG